MRLTPRRRAVLALLLALPLGWAYLYVVFAIALQLERYYRGWDAPSCSYGWQTLLNNCNSVDYSPTRAWIELIICTLIVAAIAYGLARWVVFPLRTVAATVAEFGPNSLGLRIGNNSPRDELGQLGGAIDGMLDRLAESYDAQRRFASNASHELRTPLATQRALIEVSLRSALTAEQLELLSRQLLATNERNERLIDGLLTLAETDRGLVSAAPTRLDELAAEVVAALQPAATAREVTLRCTGEPVTVRGERALLERLVTNLVQNAIKYNRPGGVATVSVTAPGQLTVANTGAPVPPEQVAGLFEPFRRLAGERLDHGDGVGLGLTIVRSIVAAHHGELSPRANPDGGLTVVVGLPPG